MATSDKEVQALALQFFMSFEFLRQVAMSSATYDDNFSFWWREKDETSFSGLHSHTCSYHISRNYKMLAFCADIIL